MVLIALSIIIAVAQAAQPRGTLALACKGDKSETTPRIPDANRSSISVDIIILGLSQVFRSLQFASWISR
jgi:hypothetical protein